ncbi:MAG: valine--tRNA ligase [Planctomycetes bacterium]|nr:valine--tRNA ligase [Planctomycetota bacterium]
MTNPGPRAQRIPEKAGDLPTQYTASEHEGRIWALWERAGAFAADPARVVSGGARPYCVLMPPANVTDRLHIGHALNGTLQDVLVRAHRMMGFETLWLPGTDHAGIATQTRVEKRLLEEEGKGRHEYGREAFVARVQSFKDQYEATITEQLKRMGASADWDRRRFTMDEVCARAVREAFFRLFKDGLIYRGKRLVNWDPVTQTALADDEVEDREVDGKFYYLRYPLAHPRDGDNEPTPVTWSELAARGYPRAEEMAEDERAWVTIATTRPETYLGDTAVAVNPADPRAPALRTLCVELPVIGRVIPIVEDEYVVMADPESSDARARYATGFLKVTPAHDPNDWEIGQRHALKVINVMGPDASISDRHGWDDPEELRGGAVFVGLSREDARVKVVQEFRARGLVEAIKPYRHSVGHSYRSHAAIEPYLSDQWYVKVTDDRLSGEALRAMADEQYEYDPEIPFPKRSDGRPGRMDAKLRFHPSRYARTFQLWHENLRDWCISRQLWWGHRIPVWGAAAQTLGSAESRDRLEDMVAERLSAGTLARWRRDVGESHDAFTSGEHLEESFLCFRDDPTPDEERILHECGYEQDPDVLDTWFSSALWPISTMGWPDEESELLGAFNPSNALCTAREIITLWVSRMVMFNRYFREGDLPFTDVFIHALVMDGRGRKMSKSIGNGVDPLDIIASHGADAMRYTLCKMTTHTQDIRLPVERDTRTGRNTSPKFDEGRNFCTKLWNAGRLTVMLCARGDAPGGPVKPVEPATLPLVDRWMLSRLARTARSITRSIERFEFSPYAQSLYDLLWRDFCDWYLEAIKPTIEGNPSQRAVLRATFDTILRLLHPLTPFVTEALFEHVSRIEAGSVRGVELPEPCACGLLCRAGWPRVSETLIDDDAESHFEHLRGLVEEIRTIRAQHGVKPSKRITLHAGAAAAETIGRGDGLVETTCGLEHVTTDEPAGASVAFTYAGVDFHVSGLADEMDVSAERERLGGAIAEYEHRITTLTARLDNPSYVTKAPGHLVEQTRRELVEAETELDQVRSRFAGLPA